MFQLVATTLMVYHAFGANYPYTDQSNTMGWEPVWQLTDEFWNQNTLNTNKWYDYNPTWLGRQPGLFVGSNVEVKNGKLYMHSAIDWNIAQKYKDKGYHTFTTSAVTATNPLLYGYVEIMAKVGGSRVSSAFWLSNNQKWGGGSWTEIDVFEAAGRVDTTYYNYHTLHSNTHVFGLSGTDFSDVPSKCSCIVKKAGSEDCSDPGYWSTDAIGSFSDDWHIYGLHWTKNWFKIYVDGELIRTTTNKCFNQELVLKFDRETFPNWFGLPKTSDVPDDPFIIEYVRTWKQTGATSSIAIENKDGITNMWYAVRISGLESGVWIKSLKVKDKDMTSWKSGVNKKWYWSFYGDGPYNAPFDFKIELSTGQTITGWNIINDYQPGTVGTINYNAAFTEEEESTDSKSKTIEIIAIVIVTLVVIGCIGVGIYCIMKKRNLKKGVVTLEKEEDDQGVVDGYDMSPITASSATETMKQSDAENEMEIDIDVEVEQES